MLLAFLAFRGKSQVVVPSSGYCKFRLHDLYRSESNWMLELVKKGIKNKVKILCMLLYY